MPTPEQWLERLDAKLIARRPMVDLYERYYDGEHTATFATAKFRKAFGRMLMGLDDNWCELVVDASVERLSVEGFRFGGKDDTADDRPWEIWQGNGMDAQQVLAYTDAGKSGESYLLVAPNDDDPNGDAQITVEHPSQCVVIMDRRKRLAGIKKWIDPDRYVYANVFLPDVIAKFRSEMPIKGTTARKIVWTPYTEDGEHIHAHRFEAVPLVPMMNKPHILKGGQSDLKTVIPKQDAINKLLADMMVAAEAAAFKQRWATGVEIPIDPTTGQPMYDKYLSAVDRMWTSEDPETKFGEFTATELANYTGAIEQIVQHIAAQTRTPPHYLLGSSGAFPSGESLKSTETGLVAKVRGKMLNFGEALEEAQRLAFRYVGDTKRAEAQDAEVIWRDPESRTTAEQTDAGVKEMALEVPVPMIWSRRLGMSPQEVQRALAMRAEEQLFAPPPPAIPAGIPGAPPVAPPPALNGNTAPANATA